MNKKVARCTISDVGYDFSKVPIEHAMIIEQYLYQFARPVRREDRTHTMLFGDLPCWNCGKDQIGNVYYWREGKDAPEGEGICSFCGAEGRIIHKITMRDDDEEEVVMFEMTGLPLLFHPDTPEKKKPWALY